MRACWTAPDPRTELTPARPGMPVAVMAGGPPASRGAAPGRTFVPVDELERASVPAAATTEPAAPAAPGPERDWSLWGDAEL